MPPLWGWISRELHCDCRKRVVANFTGTAMNPFDAASPFDARYYFADPGFFERLHPYVSEKAQVRYLARVEAALAETLAQYGVCPANAAREIAEAVDKITPEEVYEEERRIQHN